ncbi:CitMHS family transporter [Citrobacter freundii complex sp. CFNIH2]|uniref:CitMHS family transporter n=1 Tax=Citrobacter freundii complex sp. CFNIH2 TaxID=2066049 RepID=UPI0021CC3464|nr:citrate:proton symporter [Citrobacter freundii complex sp. CFNIH2]
MSKRMSPLVALIVIPVIGALAAGCGADTAKYVVEGITKLAPMAAMFVFAIAFFGVVTDAGMFDPIVRGILRFVGTNPVKIIIGTGLLALIAHLDGNGAVTFLITVPTMLPLFNRLGMDKRILLGIVALSAGVNFLPWTGPMIRASAALNVTTHDLFIPLIPAQLAGLTFMVIMGWYWGKREEKRLGAAHFAAAAGDFSHHKELTEQEKVLRRPHLFWVNIALVIAVIGTMVFTRISPTVAFMIALTLALMINYPNVEMQKERINAHAKAALMMASILFAAGAFTGIMGGAGIPYSVHCRTDLDAVVVDFRSRLLLLRHHACRCAYRGHYGYPCHSGCSGISARSDDYRLPGQSTDSRDLLVGQSCRCRPRGSPKILHPGPVGSQRHYDLCRRPHRRLPDLTAHFLLRIKEIK